MILHYLLEMKQTTSSIDADVNHNTEDIFSSEKRGIVRVYSILGKSIYRLIPNKILIDMYNQALDQAIGEYETPALAGISLDFNDIAKATVKIEAEMASRGFAVKRINPNERGPAIYASDVWAEYLNF